MMMMKRNREEDCYEYIEAVKKTGKFIDYLQVMKEFKSLPYSTAALDYVTTRIKQVLNGHSELILGFNILFLPKQYYAIQQEDDATEQQKKNRVPLKSTQRVVEAADSCKKEALLHDEGVHQDYKFFEKDKYRNTDEYKKILKCLYLHSKEIISKDELVAIVGDLLQYHGNAFPSIANKDKVHEKPEKDERETSAFEASASKRRKIEEPALIDRLFMCEIDNPSYQPSTERTNDSGRTELGVAILNDSWVSKETPPTGGTYQFQKNIYQQNLFKCEDDRCERDRQSELVTSTIECMEELLPKIVNKAINLECIRLEDHFKVIQLGCIKRLYGESWQDVVDALPKNAFPVLHDVLTRLQKKLKEATSRLSETYKKKMVAVYSKNFRKSLDHGNYSCEQQDTSSSRSLSDGDDASTSCPYLLAEATN